MPITTTGAGSVGTGGGTSAPVNTAVPVISGTTTVGSVLSTTSGSWNNSPTSFDYQWKSGGVNVGLDQNTYTLVAGDVGNTVTVTVTASNAGGAASATSAAVGPISGGGGPSLDFSKASNSMYIFINGWGL